MKKLWLVLLLPALALGIYDMKWFEPNLWRAPFYDDGRWGIDITVGSGVAGGSWPSPLHNCYVFGAGLWFGSTSGSDTLVSMSYYPNSGGTEFGPTLCRYWREGTGDSLDRVYAYPGDWPPPVSRFPMAPQLPLAEMELWSCCGDSDPANHDSTGRPLGVDLYVTAYGLSDSLAQDMLFLRYDVTNASGAAMDGCYAGMVLDADVGDATDDRIGLILDKVFGTAPDTFRVGNTGFVCDNNNTENAGQTWESGTPGAVAARLLRGPGDLGLTAFKSFTIDVDPVIDWEQYLTLAGHNYQTGEYQPYDSIDAAPGDKRVLLCTGPFDLAPDSTATFWYAVVAAWFGEQNQVFPNRDTSILARRCWDAEQVFARLAGVTESPGVTTAEAFRVTPSVVRAGQAVVVSGLRDSEPVSVYDATGRLRCTSTGRLVTGGFERGVYLLRTRARTAKLVIE